ncbi:MAG: cell wall hydrolase [Ilumatobacteraceae bacterium]
MKRLISVVFLYLFFMFIFGATCAEGASDTEIIACTILGEARGEGEAGMYAVAAVIRQRSIERKITPAEVCLQRLQFSCNNKGVQLNLLKTKQSQYALRLARHINSVNTNYIKGANHYHTKTIKPYWSKNKKPVIIIGNHEFYKL